MDKTRLSTKGQIVLPKTLRESRNWKPGTEFTVEVTREGILLRPSSRLPQTSLDEVVGCLRSRRKVKSLGEMNSAIDKEIKRRHDSGRY
jgi:AbrB family looped-hinge helix DNA binding protein